jgi:hypothetical protein
MNNAEEVEKMRKEFSRWQSQRGVWPRLTHGEIFEAGWQAALQSQAEAVEQEPVDQLSEPELLQKRHDALAKIHAIQSEYLTEYEYDDGEHEHTPTEAESIYIQDAINGLLGDNNEAFVKALIEWKLYCPDYSKYFATTKASNAKDGWVSVNDEMPENNIPVLVKVGATYFPLRVMFRKDVFGKPQWFCPIQDSNPFEHFITHWQPLPEPPVQ